MFIFCSITILQSMSLYHRFYLYSKIRIARSPIPITKIFYFASFNIPILIRTCHTEAYASAPTSSFSSCSRSSGFNFWIEFIALIHIKLLPCYNLFSSSKVIVVCSFWENIPSNVIIPLKSSVAHPFIWNLGHFIYKLLRLLALLASTPSRREAFRHRHVKAPSLRGCRR